MQESRWEFIRVRDLLSRKLVQLLLEPERFYLSLSLRVSEGKRPRTEEVVGSSLAKRVLYAATVQQRGDNKSALRG